MFITEKLERQKADEPQNKRVYGVLILICWRMAVAGPRGPFSVAL